jgi:hypothetical protein
MLIKIDSIPQKMLYACNSYLAIQDVAIPANYYGLLKQIQVDVTNAEHGAFETMFL